MTSDNSDRLLPEQRARVRIDEMLEAAGWVVQDYKAVNLYAGAGVAVRELVTDAGPADYVLFVNRQVVGVIEAKKKGTTLSGVEWQTVKYQTSLPDEMPAFLVDRERDDGSTVRCAPFAYESTGNETWFTCHMDPEPTARHVFWFHRPETLEWQIEDHANHRGGTLRARIPDMPNLEHDPARLGGEVVAGRKRSAGLRRSILAAAFSGQLVPQNPGDEPASALLDRIRAERAAATPTKRTRKAKAT